MFADADDKGIHANIIHFGEYTCN